MGCKKRLFPPEQDPWKIAQEERRLAALRLGGEISIAEYKQMLRELQPINFRRLVDKLGMPRRGK